MRKCRVFTTMILSVIVLMVFSGVVWAHHGGSNTSYYESADRELTLTGVVTEFNWRNPHVFVIWNTTDDEGAVVEWTGELSSTLSMTAEGMNRDSLKPEDEVTITVRPAIRAEGHGRIRKIVKADGEIVLDRGNPSGATTIAYPPGWKICQRCQNDRDKADARAEYGVEGHPFDPHDLSGVWSDNGTLYAFTEAPPMTELGKQRYEATRGEFSSEGEPIHNAKDGMLRCDPLGYPRLFTYNYGFEFVMLPERVVQFFEFGHTWRDIWTDGRTLPDNPPLDRWLGWSVGSWEGDTFVVESNAYDDRSWISEVWLNQEPKLVSYGWPHSNEMKIVERYNRTSYGTLEATLTLTDPRMYTMPWETQGTMNLAPGTELTEYLCVPSHSEEFNRRVAIPAAGAVGR